MEGTKKNIVAYIKERGSVTARDIIDHVGISKQAVFVHLKDLCGDGLIRKIGTPPKVFYVLGAEDFLNKDISFEKDVENIINSNYFFITSVGEIKQGVDGFVYWCDRNGLDPVKAGLEYCKTLEKYNKHRLSSGLIDGMNKIKSSFDVVNLDELFYLDFYAIERFGKTKLGQLLLYSKQSQDKKIIKSLSASIRERVISLVNDQEIDGVCFIPPTVKREVQLMKELEKNLELPLKKIGIVKIRSDIVVPQKTLSKIGDRIENAKGTFFIDDKGSYNNILLIDDAVGSGATLNVVAGKIRQAKLNRGKIIGLAITGSYKGFDVISEV
jgi:hypoxanthine-guanine phosphoribosyltransferase